MGDDLRYAMSMALIAKAKKEGMIRECGDCTHWMKSRECPRERNVNGWNRGPSAEDVACGNFIEKRSSPQDSGRERDEKHSD